MPLYFYIGLFSVCFSLSPGLPSCRRRFEKHQDLVEKIRSSSLKISNIIVCAVLNLSHLTNDALAHVLDQILTMFFLTPLNIPLTLFLMAIFMSGIDCWVLLSFRLSSHRQNTFNKCLYFYCLSVADSELSHRSLVCTLTYLCIHPMSAYIHSPTYSRTHRNLRTDLVGTPLSPTWDSVQSHLETEGFLSILMGRG